MSEKGHYSYLRPQTGVWFFILGSAAFHVGLVLLLVIGGWLRDSSAKTNDRARITALLRKGKPRPKEWLPRKLPAPSKALPKELRPDPKTKPDPKSKAVKHVPAKKKPRSADYSKDMSAALASLTEEGGGKTAEEPEGSPDGVDDGDALIAQMGDEYMTKIYKAIKVQYSIPDVIPAQERMFLSAKVAITIDARGNIKDLTFEKRSGNSFFDSAIEGAVRRAAPFPAPPSELSDAYAAEGFALNFHARSM
ncbi:MAG: TonB family protein [Deltaproteobacteria bacterium]|nr:TonB family protein [Deltaproteobacteria bacterium]MBW1870466.1 TonB family protein [Deltaproteobacteria bacterium]